MTSEAAQQRGFWSIILNMCTPNFLSQYYRYVTGLWPPLSLHVNVSTFKLKLRYTYSLYLYLSGGEGGGWGGGGDKALIIHEVHEALPFALVHFIREINVSYILE